MTNTSTDIDVNKATSKDTHDDVNNDVNKTVSEKFAYYIGEYRERFLDISQKLTPKNIAPAIEMLTEKRKVHTIGVMATALKLAKHYGEDEAKAVLAAMLHDIYKNISPTELMDLATKYELPCRYKDNINLAHSKLATIKMKNDFNISDIDILNSVSYHTTGRANMSMLEKIIFIADAIEPGRTYKSLAALTELAFSNIDEACHELLAYTIEHINNLGQYLDEDTIMAEEYYRRKLND